MYYKQLNEYDRAIINAYLNIGKSIRWIALYLNRSPSTISREIKKNGVDKDNGIVANNKSILRRKNAKQINLNKYKDFLEFFYNNFDKRIYSPEMLVAIAKKNNLFKNIPSHQSLYNWINQGLLKIRKYMLLRSSNKYIRRRNLQYNKRNKLHYVPIHIRPKYILDRKEVGHWEADSVTTSNSGHHVMTIVERVSRYSVVLKLDGFHMDKNYLALKTYIMKSKLSFKSLTFDNGMEFRDMYKFKKELGINVYYCHPYAPSERGTNEVWNGMFRRFFPKGTKFKNIDISEINNVVEIINKTPRKIHNWNSSLEVISI